MATKDMQLRVTPTYTKEGFLNRCIFNGTKLEGWNDYSSKDEAASIKHIQATCSRCSAHYDKTGDRGRTLVAEENGDGWKCVECGSQIQAVIRSHSVHEFPDTLAGFGEAVEEEIPYCPECEEKPSATGHPVGPRPLF